MMTVAQWTRFETAANSAADYDNPVAELTAQVIFAPESGAAQMVNAFWDGFRRWCVRFSPPATGHWRFEWRSPDAGLDGVRGEFLCVPYTGANPLYAHGALRIQEGATHFEHADGTPFFWLGDTVWNGPAKATPEDWAYFLTDRVKKRFNIIQFVTTQWVAGAGNADLRMAYISGESLRIDPAFFQWLDVRVDMMNDFGIVGCPALIWSAPSKKWALPLNPGMALPEEQIIALARYLVARYGAHHMVWMLAGDGDYRGELAGRWQRIGRAVFENDSHPATMHPMGRIWVGGEFDAEPWFDFHGYQSSHYADESSMRWITEGPPAADWRKGKVRPTVNLEPCYEAHLDMIGSPKPGRVPFDAHAVRRACYWSVLASPVAGVTYGAHGVWGWELTAQPAMNHVHTGIAPPWRDAMRLAGSEQMRVLSEFFTSIPWWTLRPAQHIVREQPGFADAAQFISAARSGGGSVTVIYTPAPRKVRLALDVVPVTAQCEWVSPRDGARLPAASQDHVFTTPAEGDWLLLIRN